MNETKIKELEAQIKALKEEKPRTDREILESIEKMVKELPTKTTDDYIREALPFGSRKQDDDTWILPTVPMMEAPYYGKPRYGALSPDLRTLKEKVNSLIKQ